MYGTLHCPHCDTEVINDPSVAGKVVFCPGFNAAFSNAGGSNGASGSSGAG